MTPGRRLGWVLGFTQVVSWATTFYVPAVATAPVSAAFGASTAAVIGAFSSALLVSGLCAPFVGRWIERQGGRGVMAGGTLLQTAGLLALAASQDLAGWYAGWTLVGLGMAAALYDAAFATTGRVLGAGARPVITGITLIGGFASTVGWPAGVFLVAHLGWRWMLVSYAATLVVVNLPLILLLVPRVSPVPVVTAAVDAPPPPPTRGMVPLAAYFAVRALVAVMVSVNVPGLLASAGIGTADAVLIASLIGPAQVGARLVDVAFGRGFTPMATVWLSTALLPLAVVLLVVGGPPVLSAVVFVLVYGASNGVLTVVRGTLPMHLWGAKGYAARVGRLALPNLVAQAVAPTLLAPAISALPAWQVFLWMGSMGVLSGAFLLPLHRLRPAGQPPG